MFLSHDYARCTGTTISICKHCKRRESGRKQYQVYIAPPINIVTGECSIFIGQMQNYTCNKTALKR